MYLSFYNLKKQPFHITPDPEFLYLSPSHKEALAALVYGIEERKGFVALTGAIGLGKTTVLRAYLEAAPKNRLKVVYVFNSSMAFDGLLRTIYQELGRPVEEKSTDEMIAGLYEVLIEEYKQGRIVALVIDEAQNMAVDILERLRMISNLETSKDKLIQIVLVGQPEFEETLNSEPLRQLKQRLAVHSRILPLTAKESIEYVKFRIWRAGTDPGSVFTERAINMIVKKAKGIPRIINILCDNALISGFGYQKRPVTKQVVKEIIRDFEDTKRFRHLLWYLAGTATLVVVLALGVIGWNVLAARQMQSPHIVAPSALNEQPKQEDLKEQSGQTGGAPFVSDSVSREVSSAQERPKAVPSEVHADPKMRTVAPGDTLLRLARDVYGLGMNAGELKKVLDSVRTNNPQIKDADKIVPGQQIVFPEAGKAKGE